MNARTLLLIAALLPVGGCAPDAATTRPSFSDRQQRALDDPFGYSAFDKNERKYNVSGDDDPKAFRRDLDHVLNP